MVDDRSLSLGTIFTANVADFISKVGQIRTAITGLNAQMGSQARAATKATTYFGRYGKVMDQLKSRYTELGTSNKSYVTGLRAEVKAAKGNIGMIRQTISHYDKLSQAVSATGIRMNAAGKSGTLFAKTANYAALSQGVLAGKLKVTSRGFVNMEGAQRQAARGLSWVGRQISQVHGGLARLGAAMKVTAAYGIAATAIFSVVNALRTGISEIVQFDQALYNLKAITGATATEIRAMSNIIKRVAATTKFSTVEVADAMVLLGQSGFSAAESIVAIQAVSDLATGTLSTMAMSADLLTTAIRAFGLEASQASEVADIMANAINKSKLTVDKLRTAFNYVGPSASATGTTLEEVAASMMALANSGLRASTIGTGMRQIFSRLVAPSERLREAFEAHGIELDDLNIKTWGFSDVLQNLRKVFIDAKTGVVDSRKAFELFGLRGANAILALVEAVSSGRYKQMLAAVYEVGTAAGMAQTQIEGLALKFKNLVDRAKVLAVELGETGLAGGLGLVADLFKYLVGIITDFVKTSGGQLTTQLVGLTGTVWILFVALGALWKLVVTLTKTFGGLAKAFLSSPVGWFMMVVAAGIVILRNYAHAMGDASRAIADNRLEHERLLRTLESYRQRLKVTYEAAKGNEEMMIRYRAIIERLKNDFPELAQKIDEATASWERLDAVLGGEIEATRLEAARLSAQLIEQYAKDAEKGAKVTGAIATASDKVASAWDRTGKAVRFWLWGIKEGAKTAVRKVAPELSEEGKKQLEHVGRVQKAYQESFKERGRLTDSYKAKIKLANMALDETANLYVEQAQAAKLTYDEVGAYIKDHLADLNLLPETVDNIVERTIDKLRELRLEARKPIDFVIPVDPFEGIWEQATATERMAIQQIEKQMRNRMSQFRKWAEEQKSTAINVQEGLIAIRIDGYRKMQRILNEEGTLKHKAMEDEIRWLDEYLKPELLKWIEERNEWERDAFAERVQGLKEGSEKYIKLEGRLKEKLDAIREEGLRGMMVIETEKTELLKKILIERGKIEMKYLEWRQQQQREAMLQPLRLDVAGGRGTEAELRRKNQLLRREENKLAVDQAKKRLEQANENLEEISYMHGRETTQWMEGFDDVLKKRTALNAAIVALIENETGAMNENLEETAQDMSNLYEEGKISAQEYFEFIESMRDRALMGEEDFIDKQIELQESGWENFKRGIQKARREVGSFAKLMQKIGQEISEQLADNFTDAFMDFIDGTKSAGEAFRDFAKDTLRWMAQMLMRWQMMKMFSSIIPGFGGTAAATAHTGAIIGRDTLPVRIVNADIFNGAIRAHRGLGPNEVPVIAKKDEGIFTPAQMKALGAGGGMTINVPVNVEGYGAQLANKLRMNIENTVRMTLREEMR